MELIGSRPQTIICQSCTVRPQLILSSIKTSTPITIANLLHFDAQVEFLAGSPTNTKGRTPAVVSAQPAKGTSLEHNKMLSVCSHMECTAHSKSRSVSEVRVFPENHVCGPRPFACPFAMDFFFLSHRFCSCPEFS